MINKITQKLGNPQPFFVQMARNGLYEEAWKPDLNKTKPTKSEIEQFVWQKKDTHIVSIEVYFKTKDKGDFYFGTRHTPNLKPCISYVDFLNKVCDAVWNSEQGNFSSIVTQMSHNLTGKKDSLINVDDMRYIVVVLVVNWWKTFGEKELWHKEKQKEKIFSQKILKQKMGDSFPLTSDKNYAGLEAVFFSHPDLCSWFTIQCSKKKGNNYIFDETLTLNILQEVFGFKDN